MRSSDILGAINEVERRYPVAGWQIDGVGVWPLLRVQLYTETLNAHLLQDEAPTRAVRVRKALGRAMRAQLRVANARWRDRSANDQAKGRVDAVFLSDGVSFVKVGGAWYDKIFDPMIDVLRAQGRTLLLLTPMTQGHFPRRTPSMFVQPRLDWSRVRAMLPAANAPGLRLDSLDEVRANLAQHSFVVDMLAPRALSQTWRRLEAAAGYFASLLERAQPLRGFVNTYYSVEGMAFVLACRRRGVVVADVQHGLQGPHHVAYGSWQAMPEAGFELLPDEFWVWGDRERDAIDSWRPRSSAHRPVVVGNPWLETWRRGRGDFVRHELTRVEAICGEAGNKRVLVTFQWGLAEEETLKILRAALLTPATYRWWFRLHPVAARDRTVIKAKAREIGLERFEVDTPTDLPLHVLLTKADVHVTHSSSTVLEAIEFGVPSVITSHYGAELLADEVATGRATLATSDTAIARAVVASTRAPTPRLSSPVDLAEVLAARLVATPTSVQGGG